MKRPRLRLPSRCWIPLGVLLLPPLAWTLALAIFPTGWARSRVVARLEAVSGRPVTLGSLRIGVLGGITLRDVTVAAPANPSDPWLKASQARLDVSLAQLLFGRIDPSELTLDGLTLRVHRRADGTYELADSNAIAPTDADDSTVSDATEPPSLRFGLTNARISLIDEPTATRMEITEMAGRGVWEDKRATIDSVQGTLNGGRLELAAQLDRSGAKPSYEARLRVEKVELDSGLKLLAYIAPFGVEDSSGLQGNLDLNVYVRGTGLGRDDLRRTLIGQGTQTLEPVRLDRSPLVAELATALNLSETGQVGSVKSTFAIKGGRITTDDLTVDFARFPWILSGWTDFDGRLDYRLKAEQLVTARLPGGVRELQPELGGDPNGEGVVAITGSLDRASLSIDGKSLRAVVGTSEGRENKLRDLTRRMRERVLR
jgi:AsmA-like C-terminal region